MLHRSSLALSDADHLRAEGRWLDGKDERTVTFDPAKLRQFDHGYAVTSHSSQGLTQERVLANFDTGTARSLMNIYRHRAHDPALGPLSSQQGMMVREITEAELWPSDPRDLMSTDHSPMWFADGHFSFSSDQKKLVFQDKLGRRVEIELASGNIQHLN